MWADDDRPRPKPPVAAGDDLSTLSLAELEERIAALEAETARTRAALEAKRDSRSAADSFFRT